MNWKEKCTI